jgi:serine/threonine-protein kinase RsbW
METLVVEARRSKLAALRHFVSEKVAAFGVSGPAADDLILAVDESATNIIVHGYRGAPGRIELQLERQGDALIARLLDDSPYFDPNQAAPPDLTLPLEERSTGGLGIYLCRAFTDSLSYCRTPDGRNELTLIKKLKS